MKKTISVLIAFLMISVLCLTGCQKQEQVQTADQTQNRVHVSTTTVRIVPPPVGDPGPAPSAHPAPLAFGSCSVQRPLSLEVPLPDVLCKRNPV